MGIRLEMIAVLQPRDLLRYAAQFEQPESERAMTQELTGKHRSGTTSPFRPEMAFPFLTEEMLVRLAGYAKKKCTKREALCGIEANVRSTCLSS